MFQSIETTTCHLKRIVHVKRSIAKGEGEGEGEEGTISAKGGPYLLADSVRGGQSP